ncbi:MAG: hypothetical protein H0X34_05800 [Chthoniobacterales bacterium]|nr:hypothetical protein [Chthoniobacterales bacterium]
MKNRNNKLSLTMAPGLTIALRLTMAFSLTILFSLSSGKLFGQKIVQVESPNLALADQETGASGNGTIIFSNLGPTASDRYDSRTFAKLTVAGKNALTEPETWVAVNFIPKRDVQARVLLAAINYISGTSLVNLGLYSDDNGEVGTPLPGGQGSTTKIPPNGECCQLTKVTLSGSGVTLTAGTRYWLVASPDNVNGATFNGSWQSSNNGIFAQGGPPPGQWAPAAAGAWPAAEVRGTPIADSAQGKETASIADRSNRIIFSNLGPSPIVFFTTAGDFMAGKSAADGTETWLAVRFTPKVNCHAKNLAAAIEYISGDMKVNLGIYSDSDGTVGTLLPNGQASTANIPIYPSCCDLAEVVLPGSGVALNAKTTYWLVASTDDINAPSFEAFWLEAPIYSNYQEPKFFFWTFVASNWLAAEIRGTCP